MKFTCKDDLDFCLDKLGYCILIGTIRFLELVQASVKSLIGPLLTLLIFVLNVGDALDSVYRSDI